MFIQKTREELKPDESINIFCTVLKFSELSLTNEYIYSYV